MPFIMLDHVRQLAKRIANGYDGYNSMATTGVMELEESGRLIDLTYLSGHDHVYAACNDATRVVFR